MIFFLCGQSKHSTDENIIFPDKSTLSNLIFFPAAGNRVYPPGCIRTTGERERDGRKGNLYYYYLVIDRWRASTAHQLSGSNSRFFYVLV